MITDEQIIDEIIRRETDEFTNDPDDSGGPTKYGITLVTLSRWMKRKVTVEDVKNLDESTAKEIFRELYVKPFEQLTNPLRANVIDMGVNAGVYRATTLLQQMVGAVVDGDIGPETLTCLSHRPVVQWHTLYVGMRIAYYEDLVFLRPKDMKFRRGWRNRALSFLD